MRSKRGARLMNSPSMRNAISRVSGSGEDAAMGARELHSGGMRSGSIDVLVVGEFGKRMWRRTWRHASRANDACRAALMIGYSDSNNDVERLGASGRESSKESTINEPEDRS